MADIRTSGPPYPPSGTLARTSTSCSSAVRVSCLTWAAGAGSALFAIAEGDTAAPSPAARPPENCNAISAPAVILVGRIESPPSPVAMAIAVAVARAVPTTRRTHCRAQASSSNEPAIHEIVGGFDACRRALLFRHGERLVERQHRYR